MEKFINRSFGKVLDVVDTGLHPYRKHYARLIPNPFLPDPDPDEGENLDITGYAQLDGYSCGAIAGWTVLRAIYPNSSWKDFYAACSPNLEYGVSDTKLLKTLRAFGMGISTKSDGLSFEEIKKTIGSGYPILAIIDRSGTDAAHWVVIYGYSEKEKPKTQLVYIANNNFMGLHTKWVGGPNPMTYRKIAKLSEGYNSYECWGRR